MKSLTIAYSTGRYEPCLDWMLSQMRLELPGDFQVDFLVVDALHNSRDGKFLPWSGPPFNKVSAVAPKPNVWQGLSRKTREDWWAMANARNTAICLCRTDWIMFLDDRSILRPGWFVPLLAAMQADYGVCGTYQKRKGVTVVDGQIAEEGELTGEDTRFQYARQQTPAVLLMDCPGQWWFGCVNALPLEWCLAVNGYDEYCDSVSMEDVIFGLHLANSGYPLKFDMRIRLLEDRSPGQLGPGFKRGDKGVSPKDKSHALLDRLGGLKRASHPIDLANIRNALLAGGGFPPPWGPETDWWDGQPVSEF